MLWDDPAFREDYRARLGDVQTRVDVEVRAQGLALQAETLKAGGLNQEIFSRRVGAAAAAMLSGYVRGALEAFDQTVVAARAEFDEADLNTLRTNLEQDIARRAMSLPAALREFAKSPAPPAQLRAIVVQAPMKAHQLLRESLVAARERVRTRVREREVLERAIFISHARGDAALAEALKSTIRAAVGEDVPLCTSTDLTGLATGRGGTQRVLVQLKQSRMTLALVTPRSIADPSVWWTLGLASGAGKPAFVLRAVTLGVDVALPLPPDQIFDVVQRAEVVRLLQAVQSEVRRRPRDVADLDLDGFLREMAGERMFASESVAPRA
jgi:hypothetical protein